MDQQGRVIAIGQGARGFQCLIRVGVDGMRRDGRHDQRVSGESCKKSVGELQRVGRSFCIGDREADDGLPEHAAHARLFGRLGHHVLEVVHVGEGGCAAEQHFSAGEARSPADEVGRDVLGLGREDVFLEPVLQPEVVGDAAEQGHGGVGVGVDEAGSDQRIGAVQTLPGLKAAVDFRSAAHGDDAVGAHGDGSVFDDAPWRGAGEDVAGAPDPIGGLGGKRECRQQETTKKTHRTALGRDLSVERFRSCRAGSPG